MANLRRKTRQSSNVFHMLTKNQILKLREAFNLLDVDSDSRLSFSDMTLFLDTIGSPFSDNDIVEMLNELESNPSFMTLLTHISEKLSKISPETDLIKAFKLFSENGDEFIDANVLKLWMTQKGDPISEEDYDYLVRGCVENNMVNYKKLVSKIKYGEIIGQAANK